MWVGRWKGGHVAHFSVLGFVLITLLSEVLFPNNMCAGEWMVPVTQEPTTTPPTFTTVVTVSRADGATDGTSTTTEGTLSTVPRRVDGGSSMESMIESTSGTAHITQTIPVQQISNNQANR